MKEPTRLGEDLVEVEDRLAQREEADAIWDDIQAERDYWDQEAEAMAREYEEVA